jgi:hypothetical protein
MRHPPVVDDLFALREALSIGWSFGLGSLEELIRSAVALETGIYAKGSLRATATGVAIPLRNPPLRIGAFRAVRVFWDGAPIALDRARVATDRRPAHRRLADLTEAEPLELAVGEGSRYEIDLDRPPAAGDHRVRLEWESVAVPPLVWLELRDEVAGPAEAG